MITEKGAESDKILSSDDLVDLGEDHHKAGRLQEAEMYYRKALAMDPGHPGALYYLASIAYEDDRLIFATQLIEELLRGEPNDAEAWYLLGMVVFKEGNFSRAIECLNKVLVIQPAYALGYFSLGDIFRKQGEFNKALSNYNKAQSLQPDFIEAYISSGLVLLDLKRSEEALACFEKAIALKPDYAEAYNNRGVALANLKRLDEVLVCFEKAIALKPDFVEAYNNCANTLKALNRLDESLAFYDKAIALKPDYVEAYNNRGIVLVALKRLDEALACYEEAIALKPDIEFLLGTLLHTKMTICDWQGLDNYLSDYQTGIHRSKKITTPFPPLSLLDSPDLHKQAAKIFSGAVFPKMVQLGGITKRAKGEKIRIGYYSADFRIHPVSYLTAGLFELHNRNRFEIYGFSYGLDTHDDMRQRVAAAFDQFVDVKGMSDAQVVTLSRELGIDIAIDLGGHTENARTGLFALGCAPVQVSYLGFPGTMGADYIDYVIADTTVIPVAQQVHFTEKIVYMPHSFQVNDSRRTSSDRVFLRQELGLPESGVVFCCFNNSYKIGPSTFDVWMRILKAVEGSVLWLLDDHPTTVKNLRREAASRGIEEGRLVFAGRMAYGDYLARYRSADLFLDTLPYNAGTTASDALWAGLPVLTCMGKSFASRMAASLLNALELPELITHTQAEYQAKAIELALNADKLAEIKCQLEKNRLTTPLFDTALFAKHIESAYAAMYDRYHAGLAPENIIIQA